MHAVWRAARCRPTLDVGRSLRSGTGGASHARDVKQWRQLKATRHVVWWKRSRSDGCCLSARHDVRRWIDPSACGLAPDDLRCMTIAVVFDIQTRVNGRELRKTMWTRCGSLSNANLVDECVVLNLMCCCFWNCSVTRAWHPSQSNHQRHVMEAPKQPSRNPARVATVGICTLQGSTICTALIRLGG